MPIIIDKNSKDNNLEQIAKLNEKVKASITADSKLFHTDLTGSPTRSIGFFNKDTHTISQVAKDAMNKIGHPSELTTGLQELNHKELIHQYSRSRAKESYFVPYTRFLTSLALPSLFSNFLPDSLYTKDLIHQSSWSTLRETTSKLKLSRDSKLFDIENFEEWTELDNSAGIRTVVKPIIQSYHLHSAQIKSAKAGAVRNEFSVTGEPVIFLAVISYMDQVKDDAVVTIGKMSTQPSLDEIVMSLIPIDMTTSDSFLMTNYVGPKWESIMNNLDIHFANGQLDSTVHGPSTVDSKMLDMLEIIGELSVIEALNEQAHNAVNYPDEIIMESITTLLDFHERTLTNSNNDIANKYVVHALKLIVQIMDHFSYKEDMFTTDFLNLIYNSLKSSTLNNSDTGLVVQESLRLLLSQRLHELDAVKDAGQLYDFDPQDDTITQSYMNDPDYSTQQKRIITTTDPLVIGQAGAGSGKSHTLIGRIKYMKEQGEDLTKALVLSFTNVSAININQRFPDIRSETLANMFNQIYQNTYPAQELSQASTVANSLKLLNPNTPFFTNLGFTADDVKDYIERFAGTLAQLDQSGFKKVNIQEVTKSLANLIQHNMKLTEILLNAVEQTTLELQPIIIHHHLMNNDGKLNVPTEYSDLDYIITDESQDISTFEYILLLELAIHHNAQLLIVGDGSQTLYEFRNSDPKYMNALESSGVFTTFKLDVNFRSSPEVLTFANQFLDVIEANDVAQIQLKASSFTKPSAKSFEEAITVNNVVSPSTKPQDYHESLTHVIKESGGFDTWFRNIMDKDEQVAILGWTRMEVLAVGEQIEEWLDDNGYDIEVTNIMNDRSQPMTIISTILASVHNEILQLNPADQSFESDVGKIASQYIDGRYKYSSDAQKGFFLGEFERGLQTVLNGHHWTILKQDYINGNVPKAAIVGHLNREMLRIETRKNSVNNYLLRAQEAPDYSSKKILLSTIHGAKGLEFDHTIVLFNESKRGSTSQESLRMMFVALSRARQSEYIINAHMNRNHGVSDNLSAMFSTPMETAYMRALNEL